MRIKNYLIGLGKKQRYFCEKNRKIKLHRLVNERKQLRYFNIFSDKIFVDGVRTFNIDPYMIMNINVNSGKSLSYFYDRWNYREINKKE